MNNEHTNKKSKLEVINFLNEVNLNYPNAISFAAGRPAEKYYELNTWINKIPLYIDYFASKNNLTNDDAYKLIAQYGRTNGIINDLVAEQVANDEEIVCSADQVLITSGCQEALKLCLKTLFTSENDVLLVFDPTYVGMTGLAESYDINVQYIQANEFKDLAGSMDSIVKPLKNENKTVKAIYVIPDFDNPTGEVMPESARIELLKFCAKEGITILEDNPYGMFRYEGDKLPPLFSLDESGCVIYIGTFSKTICPSVRVGYIILPERLHGSAEKSAQLMNSLSITRSFITVNTCQIMQALVGGILLDENKSLKRMVSLPLSHYRLNRNAMLQALAEELSVYGDVISWNKPEGGFFLSIKLPFSFIDRDVKVCAEKFNLLCMPMSFFAMEKQFDYQVRFAFSYGNEQDIKKGVKRFAEYVQYRLEGN